MLTSNRNTLSLHLNFVWECWKHLLRMHSHQEKTIRRNFSEYFEYWHAHLLWQLENTILFKLGCTKAIIYLAEDGSDYSCGNGTVCSKVCDSVVSVPCIGRCNRSKQLDIEDWLSDWCLKEYENVQDLEDGDKEKVNILAMNEVCCFHPKVYKEYFSAFSICGFLWQSQNKDKCK